MGVNFNQNPDVASRVQRFHFLNNFLVFTCPENAFLATEYPPDQGFLTTAGLTAIVDAMPSYVTAQDFLLAPAPKGVHDFDQPVRYAPNAFDDFVLPSTYTPKITKIGLSAQKIYIADGGKFSEGGSVVGSNFTYPNYVMSYNADASATGGTTGGAYSDYGAFDAFSRALLRTNAPGNGGSTTGVDGRNYGFRHGNQKPFGLADSYRFNAGFFDGHVETLGDLEGSNPNFWNPKGTVINIAGGVVPNDTANKFCGGLTEITYTVPN
jgi:prepilin-type processing-associated H-X9-DG protein